MDDAGRWDWRVIRTLRRQSEEDPGASLAKAEERLARRYRGLDEDIIRAAWRRHFGREPSDETVALIRGGRRPR